MTVTKSRSNNQFLLSPLGSCFFLTWVNGTFSMSALSSSDVSGSLSLLYVNTSLIGVFCGLILLTCLERRFGELALSPYFVLTCTAIVCISTILMLLSSLLGTAWMAIGYIGGLFTGLCSSVSYISWTQVYASLPAENAEIAIPLAVALSQLIALILNVINQWVSSIALILMPILSFICLFVALNHLGIWKRQGLLFEKVYVQNADINHIFYNQSNSQYITNSLSYDAKSSNSNDHIRHRLADLVSLLDWRCCAFGASIWFALSSVTLLVQTYGWEDSFNSFAVTFIVSFLALLTIMLLYVLFARRLSQFDAARITVPIMILGLLVLLVIPNNQASIAFLIVRTISTFYWALLWIACAQSVRDGYSSATHITGIVRAWIQGGAVFSIPTVLIFNRLGLEPLVFLCIALLIIFFSLALPPMAKGYMGMNLVQSNYQSPIAPDENPKYSKRNAIFNDTGENDTYINIENIIEGEDDTDFEKRCAAFTNLYGLSPREADILKYLIKGRNMPFIREHLFISRNTINTHIRHIYQKVGIHSKQELIDRYEEMNIKLNQ